MWLANGDEGRRKIVASYFALSPKGGWSDIEAYDITGIGGAGPAIDGQNPIIAAALSFLKNSVGDPMFVVMATKK